MKRFSAVGWPCLPAFLAEMFVDPRVERPLMLKTNGLDLAI
jgi:hypothetical protein